MQTVKEITRHFFELISSLANLTSGGDVFVAEDLMISFQIINMGTLGQVTKPFQLIPFDLLSKMGHEILVRLWLKIRNGK